MTNKEIQQTIGLLTACGMVSRSEHYTHKAIRELVARSIHRMQPEQRTALLNTIRFLLHFNGGAQ